MRKYAVNPMYNHINRLAKLHNLNREGREHADKQNLIKSKNKVFISFLPDKIRRLPKLHPKMAEP